MPHAATVAVRVFQRLQELDVDPQSRALELARELAGEIGRYRVLGDPEPAEAMIAQADALDRARKLTHQLQAEGIGSDRLGQSVRNLFECLGHGQEGSEAGLRAGEDPNSLQRP